MKGNVEQYNEVGLSYNTEISKFDSYGIIAGLSYDCINFFSGRNTKWSLPVLVGLNHQQFSVVLKSTSSTSNEYVEGENYGYYRRYVIGVALSRSFDLFGVNIKFTPYLLYFSDFLSAPALHVTHSNGTKYDVEMESGTCYLPGFSVQYISEGSWSFGLSLGGIISSNIDYYSENFLEGLQMKTFSITATYRFNANEGSDGK